MAEPQDEGDEIAEGGKAGPRRRLWPRVLLGFFGVLGIAVLYAWITREDIADNIIASQLESLGIPATYKIESIGPGDQVLSNIVVGDARRPDATIERAEVSIRYRFGFPRIGQVKLTRPRVYGSYREGKLSFGALDPLIFAGEEEPSQGLPDINLALVDGRGLLETDFGPVGIKADGKGNLRGGFSGILAVSAPHLFGEGCALSRATLYGKVSVQRARPRISGPLRVASLACPQQQMLMRDAAVALDVKGDADLAGLDTKFDWRNGAAGFGQAGLSGINGQGSASWRNDTLALNYDVAARGIESSQIAAALLTGKGSLRGRAGMARLEWESDWEANGVRLGSGLDTGLRDLERSSEGTLLAPMAERIRLALVREGRGSRLVAQTTLRKTADGFSLIVPQASLRGGSGATLLSLSRFLMGSDGKGAPRLAGNFVTGGMGLPQITGRIEQQGAAGTQLRLAMAEYRAGGGSLAVPELYLVQHSDGALGFAGQALAEGALPGGSAKGLVLPVSGNWSPGKGLAVWRKCTEIRFDRLALAGLALERRGLTLCPPRGGPILLSNAAGTRIAAGSPGLDVAGQLGESPIRIRSGPLGFAVPGVLAARDLDVVLGPEETATRFRLANLDAKIGKDVAGRFDGADFQLYQVPFDVLQASGDWRFANGRLSLGNASLRVEDREALDRFEPLIATGASLDLSDNVITADALLQEPKSGRNITRIAIRHDLGSGAGQADLAVDGLVFDNRLQPDTLTGLALGVVANARGTVLGDGRIEWDQSAVRSSGRFSTSGLDFAAAFGPVKGLSGTVVFTDLLNLVTAPDQRLKIASINPGIEVLNGELVFALRPGNIMAIENATWPFMGGTLVMQPASLPMGATETRRFVLQITGLDAGQFVEHMELANISATGTFDGTLPLVFDKDGGHLQGGMLVSRSPGGNVAYVGELSYKDLSAMANFAFDALRSLNYTDMTIAMDGELTGDFVTRVRFDGVKQGTGTTQNFLTKQIAKLPVRFNVNIHAPFYKLITTFKSMYDPAFVRDPRELGLVDQNGQPIVPGATRSLSSVKREEKTSHESAIQPSDSEGLP
ncbi:YdbH domain-containing protein [Tsuneonella sp. CC-YZS046]|uniref:YdbH domain-containing protein n=1 Tax=Tsuneonella sp. CC-YZS046 TaxID=3042152 RepID=UPI002D79337A|nr:YdbH domain-containing protein [Tsuneonella sp. CC-YZS046]WRO67959.1 YdbH domain-containing protein [Tsuneonella sp. CC-YZS046]